MKTVTEIMKQIDELEYAVLGAMALGNDAAFKRVKDTKAAIKDSFEELTKDAARYLAIRGMWCNKPPDEVDAAIDNALIALTESKS